MHQNNGPRNIDTIVVDLTCTETPAVLNPSTIIELDSDTDTIPDSENDVSVMDVDDIENSDSDTIEIKEDIDSSEEELLEDLKEDIIANRRVVQVPKINPHKKTYGPAIIDPDAHFRKRYMTNNTKKYNKRYNVTKMIYDMASPDSVLADMPIEQITGKKYKGQFMQCKKIVNKAGNEVIDLADFLIMKQAGIALHQRSSVVKSNYYKGAIGRVECMSCNRTVDVFITPSPVIIHMKSCAYCRNKIKGKAFREIIEEQAEIDRKRIGLKYTMRFQLLQKET